MSTPVNTSPVKGDAPAPRWSPAVILEPLSIAILLWYLLWKTWMRWPDPLIDFPRSLYTAWRMNAGDLLYENISSWYGPLPHLVEALAFRIFGVGLDTMVWLNIVIMVVVLVLIRQIFWALADRLTVWLVSVVFLAVFGVAQFVGIGNYNFVTPYASQATYGLAGCLLTIWALLRHLATGKRNWLVVAGAGFGIAYVDKPEPLLATSGILTVYMLIAWVRIWRQPSTGTGNGPKVRAMALLVGWVLAGFAAVFVLTFLALAMRGGVAYGFGAVNWVPHSILVSRSGQGGLTSPIILTGAGMDHPMQNLGWALLYGLLLIGCVLVVQQAGIYWSRARATGQSGEGALVVALGVTLLVGWATAWSEIGHAFLIPVALAATAAVIASLRQAWRGDSTGSRWMGLAILGVGATLMLSRMLLNGRIYHYGFFMALLAALFLVYLVVYQAPRWGGRDARPNELTQIIFAALVLSGVGVLHHQSQDIFSQKTFALGEGRDRFYTFQPQTQMGINGALLNEMLTKIRETAPNAKSVIAFPETAAVNYYLRLPNPVVALEFHPWALNFLGRDKLLAGLNNHPPDVVALYLRDLSEYGPVTPPGQKPEPYFFGSDENGGRPIFEWIAKNYLPKYAAGDKLPTPTGHAVDIFVHKPVGPAQ